MTRLLSLSSRPQEVRSEWTAQPPEGWERRLREISPKTDRTDHLVFRWRAQEMVWMLYAAMPKGLVRPDRALQFVQHWSDLDPSQQQGRKSLVSEYQFYMWHQHGVEVRPFWCLQGTQFLTGGTPATYSDWEKAILVGEGIEAEVVPWGMLDAIPFDERVVKAIQHRDRLLKAGNDLDRLIQKQSAEGLRAEDELNAQSLREHFLRWHNQQNAPITEFLKWYRHQEEYKDSLGKLAPPSDLPDTLDQWKDEYVSTGTLVHAGSSPRSLLLPVTVKLH